MTVAADKIAGMNVGQLAQLACIFEATARKPGNVHRYQDFADLSYVDFLLSAIAIAPVFDQAAGRRVGVTILDAIRATRQVVKSNTNLGMVLLLAPLAAVPMNELLEPGLPRVLDSLDVEDARLVYEAIRLAQPGGLGQATEQDISHEPTLPLREVMALASDRDLIARQYANGFHEVFFFGVPVLQAFIREHQLESAIMGTHLHFLAHYPDSLIARKCGPDEAEAVRRRAQAVLDVDWLSTEAGRLALAEFDAWLRADGNRRNPGATADLVAASLFAALRGGIIPLPTLW